MHNIRDKMQKSGKFSSDIVIVNNVETVTSENGKQVDPISVYAKTQHVFAEVRSFFGILKNILMNCPWMRHPLN